MLSIEGIHKRYGPVTALDGCTFTVRRGRMLGFLGPNGAGKTTAMRTVFGLVRPDAGEVRWEGRHVDAGMRARFGYMPEQRGLYPKMRLRDQLTYFGRLHGMPRQSAVETAERWLHELGLGERLTEPLENLSHGNQQRVQLAAALIHDPELLVLDEPFSGLDPLGVETMARVLAARAAAGTAVVFSSHQLDLVEDLCQDVAIIHRGRVVLGGEVDELKRQSVHRRLELDLTAAQATALDTLTGVVDRRFDGRHHVLTLEASTDVSHLLAALGDGDHVEHFVYTTPSLADLFREAVA